MISSEDQAEFDKLAEAPLEEIARELVTACAWRCKSAIRFDQGVRNGPAS